MDVGQKLVEGFEYMAWLRGSGRVGVEEKKLGGDDGSDGSEGTLKDKGKVRVSFCYVPNPAPGSAT